MQPENIYVAHRFIILFVNLDGLVCLGSQESAPAVVKGHGKDAGIAVEWPRLGGGLGSLEVEATLPVPEMEGSIISWGVYKI